MHVFHLESSPKGLLEVKSIKKFRFLGCFSKAKTKDCDQKISNVFDQFGITIPCSDTYFLEVDTHFSLKVATKGSLRGQK